MFVLSSIDRRISHSQPDPNWEAERGVRSTGFMEQLDAFAQTSHSCIGLIFSRAFKLLVFHSKKKSRIHLFLRFTKCKKGNIPHFINKIGFTGDA